MESTVFIGGSDARVRLRQEKRGEVGPAPACGSAGMAVGRRPAAPYLLPGFFGVRFRSTLRTRNPSPPPFSEKNSMPTSSNALRIRSTASSETCRRSFSKSTTVDNPKDAASASCDCVISKSARAARHCDGVILATIFVDHRERPPYKQLLLIHLSRTHGDSSAAWSDL
jgi:hypothetical protein